jgi:hypothetical protein
MMPWLSPPISTWTLAAVLTRFCTMAPRATAAPDWEAAPALLLAVAGGTGTGAALGGGFVVPACVAGQSDPAHAPDDVAAA